MNVQISQLLKSLLLKDSLDDCSLDEVQQFADRYPYFGAAQLLLAKKMQTENPDKYDNQFQKTCLYFHSPLWVDQLLNDTGKASIQWPEKKEELIALKTTQPAEVDIPEENHYSVPQPGDAVSTTEKKLTDEPQETATAEPAEAKRVTLSDENKGTLAAVDELIFEPYHTVDYFASQGIKFAEENKSGDKFGQQLKSFTEWLKTMKKLPVAELVKSVESASEKKVEQLAEHSLEDPEVITEAMAAVWEKQGKKEKAIEMYSKLSLLEPSKSPYFAAKIELLKKEN